VKLPRRQFLRLAAGAAALPALSRVARAQAYPARPVRIVVGFAAGGTTDIAARLIGQWLSDHLAQQFIVENRAGAGTNIATEAVVRAASDGYTLLTVSATNTVNATLYNKLNFNFIRDIAPVAGITRTAFVMAVHPSFPAKTVPEFIAYAKANPGKLNIGGSSPLTQAAVELFKVMAGVNINFVTYRGDGPGLTDLMGRHVEMYVGGAPAVTEQITSGTLHALAVTTATRLEALAEIPTVGEFVPGYEASVFNGLGAPRNTSAAIIDRLNKEINAGLADPKLKQHLAEVGGTVLPGSPADFGKLIADETEKWGKVVKFAGLKAD
jgi:tripartite-type tricarboxylate transporter receptor subunit TctC